MEITHIFEVLKDRLFAAEYDNCRQNILGLLQDQWSDPVFLEQFFENNKADLQSGFYGKISIDQVVEDTIVEANLLFDALYDVNEDQLDHLFRPLYKHKYKYFEFQKRKAKGAAYKSWLRIYAVSYCDAYMITGGTIKLTKEMKDRPHTQN